MQHRMAIFYELNWQSINVELQYFICKGYVNKWSLIMNTLVYVYIIQSMDGSYHIGSQRGNRETWGCQEIEKEN